MSSGATVSSTPSATTATPASSSTNTSDSNSGGTSLLSSQASLYLYTFLVTLILLLAVSGAIVLRSYVVRRRQRRMVEEAIRNGTYVPPERAKGKKLGEKPVLYDVYLTEGDKAWIGVGGQEKSSDKSMPSRYGELQWDTILPLSAIFLGPDGTSSLENEEKGAQSASLAPGTSPHARRRRLPLRLLRFPTILTDRIRGSSSVQLSATASATSAAIPSTAATSKLPSTRTASKGVSPSIARMSVVVRMPSPPFQKTTLKVPPKPLSIPTPSGVLSIIPPAPTDPSEELPHVEFGIADVRMRGLADLNLSGEDRS
ncbi:hypothetical protein PHLGIDRAFT_19341 [Phlebiopsis gigantea 11061_1 CR5-6]|uniref:Uncharacterized protein n=1 Tax=Phlebiopsis gigantea (strain 11061_1 CR5-6) TaxID=745531 RepID=A0A0C3RY23_PHLG1|nr:hypothetical protein PHLGIDRAFT_19341 [Phlebiopsis gigantea 11061_1 CR5-6]